MADRQVESDEHVDVEQKVKFSARGAAQSQVGEEAVSEVGDARPADAPVSEETPNPAAQRVLLFTADSGTRVYGVKTEQQRYLPVTALVVPLGSEGGTYGGFAQSLKRDLPGPAWERIASELDSLASQPITPEAPSLIALDVADVLDILPNAPQGHADQVHYLIAATAAGTDRPEDLRVAASAIVRKAHEAGISELGVLPLGTGRGPFKDQPEEVASQMIHGIWAALLDLPDSPLREITFATREDGALESAYRKANLLTRNVAQQIWGDQPADKDLLGIKNEAEALAETLLLRRVLPPLAVGILGGWGSGKSTVMRLMMRRMTQARMARVKDGWAHYDNPDDAPTRVGHIYQIRFNAWTYAKSNLWASLMQTIFWELNRQLTAEQRLFSLLEAHGRTPLDGGKEFQFLYDAFARPGDDLWADLPQEFRAALQADSNRNVLWQQLRAKHRQALETLQEKEEEIAQLKAQRERAENKRRTVIMRELGQESREVVYSTIRRRSRALLGDVYEQVMKQVDEESHKALAGQLRDALSEIAVTAEALKTTFAETDNVHQVAAALSDVSDAARGAVRDAVGKGAGEQIRDLKEALQAIQQGFSETYREAARHESADTEPLVKGLDKIERQIYQALALDDTEVRAAVLFEEVRSLRIVGRKVGAAMKQQPLWTGIIVTCGLILLALAIFVFLNPLGWLNEANAIFAGTVATIGSIVTLFGPPLRLAAKWGRQVSELVDTYQQEYEAEREHYQTLVESRLAEARADDERELKVLLASQNLGPDGKPADPTALRERPLQPNLAALDHKIQQLETEAEELRRETGPTAEFESLLDFVQARQDDQFYEKQLGLMHQVRRDIDVLTGGLVPQPEDDSDVVDVKEKLFPRGPARIVLYIDDLDRCPPNRVVEVLEAVQLLLNTELFVVVLGLDTRYITRALEKEYKEILQPDGDPSGLDYIEKILQLPYRVRPIDAERLRNFLSAQMDLVRTDEEPPQRSPQGDGLGAGEGGHEDGESAGTAGRAESGEHTGEGAVALPELPPEVIKFQPEDLDDLETCCRQLTLTPRNVKRLVNVLKLINVFWFRTGGDLRGRPTKRAVVGLLALSAGYPEIMREAFAQMVIKYRDMREVETLQVGQFLSDLSLPRRWVEQHESLGARFRADIDVLHRPEQPEESFFGITLAELGVRTFNLVRAFSFVGDPVYLGDGASESPRPLSPSAPGSPDEASGQDT